MKKFWRGEISLEDSFFIRSYTRNIIHEFNIPETRESNREMSVDETTKLIKKFLTERDLFTIRLFTRQEIIKKIISLESSVEID